MDGKVVGNRINHLQKSWVVCPAKIPKIFNIKLFLLKQSEKIYLEFLHQFKSNESDDMCVYVGQEVDRRISGQHNIVKAYWNKKS